ncbi:MAG: hypothetical protein HUU55_03100 [Myxococcales bacterium]|nr:hypothetical protein [Myxococcales bacterium]
MAYPSGYWRLLMRLRLGVLCILAAGCADQDSLAPSDNPLPADTTSDPNGNDSGEVSVTDFDATFDVTTLFDLEKLRSPDGINLQVKKDVIRWNESEQVWLVPFAFRSQIWHGNAWDHPSLLYVPKNLNPAFAGTIAMIQQGTTDLDTGLSMDFDFGSKTAAMLGVPVAVLAKIPHPTVFSEQEDLDLADTYPECFGVSLVENELEACGNRLVLASEQVKWSLQIAMVRAEIRAITAISLIPDKLSEIGVVDVPKFTAKSAVIGAGGKRARVLWLAAVVDDRIAGIWLAAADMANFVPFYQNMVKAWSKDYPFGEPEQQIAFFSTGFGKDWRSIIDPYGYMERRPDIDVMIVAGTNDALYPLGSYGVYSKRLPPDWSLLHVPNYGHGMASEAHLDAWRAFIARVAGNRPLLKPLVTYDEQSGTIVVGVVLEGSQERVLDVQDVTLSYTSMQVMNADRDLRDAVWEHTALSPAGVDEQGRQRYSGAFTPTLDDWGAYVTVDEKDSAGLSGTSSSVVRLSWQ